MKKYFGLIILIILLFIFITPIYSGVSGNSGGVSDINWTYIVNPVNNEILVYDSSIKRFVNQIPSSSILPTANNAILWNSEGNEIVSPLKNQIFVYDTDISKWVNINPSFLTNPIDNLDKILFVSSNAKVGIATTNPIYDLDVAGDIRCVDLYVASASIYIGEEKLSLSTTDEGALYISGNMVVLDNVTANSFVGDGTGIENVTAPTSNYALDSDKLDGQHGSYYQNADNLNAGEISLDRLPDSVVTKNYQSDMAIANSLFYAEPSTNTVMINNNDSNLAIGPYKYSDFNAAIDGNLLLTDDFVVYSTSTASVFYVDSATERVGIGVNTPNAPLHIDGGTDASYTSGGHLVLGPMTGTNLVLDGNEIIARFNGEPSDFYLQKNGGKNVILGNTIGYQKLNIDGQIRLGKDQESQGIWSDNVLGIDGDTSILIVADINDSGPGGDIVFGNGSATANPTASFLEMFPTYAPISEYLRIKGATGFVGIGTASPDFTLDVSGDIRCVDIHVANEIAGVSGIEPADLYIQKDDEKNVILGTGNGNQKLNIDGQIRLGVGNESQGIWSDNTLGIGGDGSVLIVSDVNSQWGTGDIVFGNGTATTSASASFSEMFPAYWPKAEHMRVKGATGFVGIGTTSPGVALDVSGDVNISDILSVASINVTNLEFASANVGEYIKFDGTYLQKLLRNSGSVKIENNSDESEPTFVLSPGVPHQITYNIPVLCQHSYFPETAPTKDATSIYGDVQIGTNNYVGIFKENPVLGQMQTWRIAFSYSGKSINAAEGVIVRLENPILGFKRTLNTTLPDGQTSDEDVTVIINTFANEHSLQAPFGNGVGGYQFFIESTKQSITVVIKDIYRGTSQY